MPETRSYRVVRNRSKLWADVKATLQQIRIEASDFEGEFDLPAEDEHLVAGPVTRGSIRLATASLDGGNRLFNRDLHRTIESRKYRDVVGEIREIVAGAEPDEFVVRGVLRLHGERSEVEGRVKAAYLEAGRVRLTGESSFHIRDHGIQPRRLVVLTVEPTVRFFGDLVVEPVGT